jgi:phthiocerol/phenolphthiocerol synthesis type-I polyketide synthase C
MVDSPHPTLVHALLSNAAVRPQALAYRFLEAGDVDGPIQTWSHGDLAHYAARTATLLRREGLSGQRVLLLYAPGMDFAGAFLGCCLAGAVAVPAYPPDPTRISVSLARLKGIADDAQVAAILTTQPLQMMLPMAAEEAPSLVALPCYATDTLEAGDALDRFRPPSPEALAFLQYTSGSTGHPKGVMITHGHIVAQLGTGARHTAGHANSHVVSWLPQYHDLGLMTGFLMQPFLGCSATVLSPVDFLKRPLRWLEAISRFGGTHAGGPDFGYALCAKKATPEQAAALDLSSWHTAFNAAEPVRQETIDLFCTVFAPSRFPRRAFMPGYGLAEATMGVTWAPHAEVATRRVVDPDALSEDRIAPPSGERQLTLFGHGPAAPFQVLIVDPETRREVSAERIGEIWVSGPSVGLGYWNRPEETERTFRAFTQDGRGPFLRTGDLGAMLDGQLYITGRRSDLIILRGRNYYPHDFEWTLEAAHPAVRPGCVAAFSIEADGEERLAVVCEAKVATPEEAELVVAAIRSRVAADHGVSAHLIALAAARAIPKTSSGKIQRRATKKALLEGTLELQTKWERPAEPNPQPTSSSAPGTAELEQFVLLRLRAILGEALAIDAQTPLRTLGLDSKEAIGLVAELEQHTGRRLSPTVVYDHPSARALALHLSGAGAPSRPEQGVAHDEPIAIIGLAGRFPGAHDVESLWAKLLSGADLINEVPADRFDVAQVYDPDPSRPGKVVTRHGGFLEQVAGFDAAFFGIAPREATAMDPQQRLLLEETWAALEDAGVRPSGLAGTDTAVAIGISSTEYGTLQFRDLQAVDAYSGTGSALSIAANRLSYFLDLRGPSYAIDTACSSSLVAIHLACEALRRGESRLAIAGGVSLILSPAVTVNFSKAGAMAKDGRCKTFDARADGYVRSEGVGVVILKPLSQAMKDGDRIRGVIRGTATGQDGRTNGLMAPSKKAQSAVIQAACIRAGVAPSEVAYVEAHGTGTALGDTIEAEALAEALRPAGPGARPLKLGSIKSNLGHLEAAAGVAGLIKTVLCLEQRRLPASLHFQTPNPQIPFEALGLEVVAEAQNWPERARFAGISSFGFGGTLAHAILEVPPPRPEPAPVVGPAILPLSAKSEAALRLLQRRWRTQLSEEPRANDLLYTAGERRDHHAYRHAFVGVDLSALQAALEHEPPVAPVRPRRVAFVFPGQGGQWVGMGQELYAEDPVFRGAVDQAVLALEPHLTRPLGPPSRWSLKDIAEIQPAIFVLQVALFRWLESKGVRPEVVIGHSMGELAAAHVAGALSLQDAARIISLRSQRMLQVAGRGAMLYTELGAAEAATQISSVADRVAVAAYNGPRATVLSGDRAALEPIRAALEAQGTYCRFVKVEVASHSPEVDPILPELAQALGQVESHAPTIEWWSTVHGRPIQAGEMHARYWLDNLRQPVQFTQGIAALVGRGIDLIVELSPHPTLTANLDAWPELKSIPTLRRGEDGRYSGLWCLAELYNAGLEVELGLTGRVCAAPRYPFQHQPFWSAAVAQAQVALSPEASGFRPGWAPADDPERHYWSSALGLATHPWLADHRIEGQVVVPGSVALLSILEAAEQLAGGPVELGSVQLERALRLSGADTLQMQVVLHSRGPGRWRAELHAAGGDQLYQRYATAEVAQVVSPTANCPDPGPTTPASVNAYYQALQGLGLDYGPALRRLLSMSRGPGGVEAQLEGCRRLDPIALDAALQAAAAVIPTHGRAAVPSAIGKLVRLGPGVPTRVVARRIGPWSVELMILDPAGQPVLAIRSLTLQVLDRGDVRLYEPSFVEAPLTAPAQAKTIVVAAHSHPTSSPLVDALSRGGHLVHPVDLDPAAVLARCQSVGATDLILLAGPFRVDGDAAAEADREPSWRAVLGLLAAGLGTSLRPRLWLITEGAVQVPAEPRALWVAGSVVWGLGQVLANEHPGLHPTVVDLDPEAPSDNLVHLTRELSASGEEDRIAFRRGRRYVARLQPLSSDAEAPLSPLTIGENFALAFQPGSTFEGLRFRRVGPASPGPGQVRIRVKAAGLNFSDVLKVLGAYPGRHQDVLGAEVSGIVEAVGPGVDQCSPGQKVMAIVAGGFASTALARAELVRPLPEGWSFAAGASLPIAWLTAAYGLQVLGRLGAGERVLIHAATGGVGLAALAIAKRLGAEVHATAGTPEKRAYLRELGVSAVYDSRDPAFIEALFVATAGRGVDVVLGAPTGPVRQASLQALAPFGRYVDLGKQSEGAERLPANGALLHLDLAELIAEAPARLGKFWAEAPPPEVLPHQLYPASGLGLALGRLAAGQHRGKLVIELDSPGTTAGPRVPKVEPDGIYLITGGTGGLGLDLAEALIERGAKSLVLASRRPARLEAQHSRWRAAGVTVQTVALDVADPHAVAALIGSLPTLRGVFHLAGVLDDGLLAQQTPARFEALWAAKVHGAWALHRACAGRALDYFVLYSSAADALGSPGQGGYAAASAFLSSLARARVAQGEVGLAIEWGPFAEVGLVADAAHQARFFELGLRSFSPVEARGILDRALSLGRPELVALAIDPERARTSGVLGERPFLSALRGQGVVGLRGTWAERLSLVAAGEQRAQLSSWLAEEAAAVLRLPVAQLDPTQPLQAMGIDSLMALELRNRLERATGLNLNATVIWRYPNLERLAAHLSEQLGLAEPSGAAPEVPEHHAPPPLAEAEAQGLLDLLGSLRS